MINDKYHCPHKNITFPNDHHCGSSECCAVCLNARLCAKLECGTCGGSRTCPYYHFITKELWRFENKEIVMMWGEQEARDE